MTTNAMEERLAGALAYSLALHRPSDYEEALLDSLARSELGRRLGYTQEGDEQEWHCDDDSTSTAVGTTMDRILKHAQEQAAVLRKRKVAEQSRMHPDEDARTQMVGGTSSFSLFGGVSSSLLLNSAPAFFSWPAAQEQAETTRELLELLQKVDFVDDILPDWETGIRTFLHNALLDTGDNGETKYSTVACNAVRLHRKWYQLTRSSASLEYQTLQLDLLENLVQSLVSAVQEGADLVKLAVATSLDIFADIVDQGSVQNRMRLYAIGTSIWTCFLVNPSSEKLLQIMIDHDPHAGGLTKWIMGLTPQEVVVLLTMKTARAKDSGNDRLESQGDDEVEGTTILARLWFAVESRESMLENAWSSLEFFTVEQQPVNMLTKACFSRSILRSALVTTRVSGFPWHQVAKTATIDASATVWTAALISALAGSYCRLLYGILVQEASNDAQPSPPNITDSNVSTVNMQLLRPRGAIVMCVDALSTLLSGCMQSDDRTLEAVRQRVRELQLQLASTDRLLSCTLVPSTMRLLETLQP